MNSFYFFFANILMLSFYFFPFLGYFSDSRGLIKVLSFVTLVVGVGAFYKSRNEKESLQIETIESFSVRKKEIFFTIGLLLSISFAYLFTLFQHLDSFFLMDYDFLAIGEILNNSVSGLFFRTHHYGNGVAGNYLSHHFSPSLLLLSPFLLLSYTRLGYAYGLLCFVLCSYILLAILLYKKKIRGNLFYFSMLLVSFNIYLHRLFFSYHFELLIVFFFLLFFIGKEFKKIYLSVISILFLLLLKEDVAIYVFCFGLYFLIQKDWKYGFSLTAISVLYFFFIPAYFQQFLDNTTRVDWLKDWSRWGNTYGEIAFNLLTSPIQVVNTFFLKWKVLRDLLLSFSPLLLLSPSIILVSLPILLLHFISDRFWYNTLYNYYCYPVVSFYLLGLIFSIAKIQNSKYNQYGVSILIFAIFLSLYSSSSDKFFPFSKIETEKERVQNVKEVLKQIPEHKTVATQFDLGAFLPRTNPLYPLHEKNLDKDYLLIDTKKGITPYVDKERIKKMISEVTTKKTYTLILEKEGIQLYRKN